MSVNIAKASIIVRNPESATSYTVKSAWEDPESGIPLDIVFNVNTNTIVEKFHSEGAPEKRTLDMEYTSPSQFAGYHEFRGTIGAGRIDIRLANGVVFKGKIVGGPQAGQAFVGAGTWTRS
ncbi:unnamed protein product [Rhizoctonia solani]|uniref:Uncharacterized protein n=1 Tax=Rhizoctonia solani TaxID=456999 RepID=A0A8H3BG43_9AGAM|nr:unnamed protein product [Rhizoctonia solani]CAE6456255.1 unnamed protein product [Rhizoctonia solani]